MKVTVLLKNGSFYMVRGSPKSFLNNKEIEFIGRFVTRTKKQEETETIVALLIEVMGDHQYQEGAQVTVISALQEPMAKMRYSGSVEENLLDIARDIEAYLEEER